jgi:hypothetical protein
MGQRSQFRGTAGFLVLAYGQIVATILSFFWDRKFKFYVHFS